MSRYRKLRTWLPLTLTLALLGVSRARIAGAPTGAPRATEAHLALVGRAIDEIPYKIGRWLGEDEATNPAAYELLNPNRLLQRRYTNIDDGDLSFSLLVSHCPEERDMLGHYPPVCYPAHGWLYNSDEMEDVSIPHGGGELDARRYVFSRRQGLERTDMVIYNFFVVPSELLPFARSMDPLDRPDVLLSRREGGVAQVQVLLSPGLTRERELEVASNAAGALRGMFEAIHTDGEGER